MQPALNWLNKNNDKKFFLFLHGYVVHGNFLSPRVFDYRFVKKPYEGSYTGSVKEWNTLREALFAGNGPILTDEDIYFWRALYDEKISRADEQLGRVFNYLQVKGLMEKSIVVVLSDHGAGFFEHEFGHGNSLYGEILDVLLAIRMPGQKQGKSIDSLVSTLDVTPTILSLLGIKDPAVASMKGVDLTPATKGETVSRDIYFETDFRNYTHKRGIQTPDGWKMILTMENLKRELYNLKTDPAERVNLAEKEPKITYELEQKIYRHLKEMKASEGPWRLGCPPELSDKCQSIQIEKTDIK
jgi:arylsulfatase A-like enzyme